MDIVLRTALMYVFILFVLRVTTRRILRSATPLPSILANDVSVTAAILGMSTVAALHFSLSYLRMRWPIIGMLTEGTSVVLYADGAFDDNQMTRSRVTRQDIEAEMRKSGQRALDDVEKIIVEHNGGITIVPIAERAD